jgi:hypothetical protein
MAIGQVRYQWSSRFAEVAWSSQPSLRLALQGTRLAAAKNATQPLPQSWQDQSPRSLGGFRRSARVQRKNKSVHVSIYSTAEPTLREVPFVSCYHPPATASDCG